MRLHDTPTPAGDISVRPAKGDDGAFITTMLLTAVRWDPTRTYPADDVLLADPRIAAYVADWPHDGDAGVVACAADGSQVGAAWSRFFRATAPGYGFVDARTPEVSLAVVAEQRGAGVGTALLTMLHTVLRASGVRQVSLSVEEANPAYRLYQRHGYRPVGRDGGAVTCVCRFGDDAADEPIRLRSASAL